MKKSIRVRVVFLYIMLVFIVMIVSGTVMLLRVRSKYIDEEYDKLIQVRKMAVDYVFEGGENGDSKKDQEQILKDFGYFFKGNKEQNENDKEKFKEVTNDMEIFILTSSGGVLDSTSYRDESYIKNLFITSSIMSAMDGNESFSPGTSINEGTYLEYAYPYMANDSQVNYIIYIREDMVFLQSNLSLIASTIVIASIVALFLAATIGLLFSGTLTGPILTLTRKATDLAEGNFSQEIPIESQDEIGKLTENFNYMAKTLNATISYTESEKTKLEILLHNMTDGVLAFDSLGNLMHANQVSYELLEIDKEKLSNLKTILEKFDIDLDNLDDVSEYTIPIGEKYITAVFSTYSNSKGILEGIVIVLQDVTKHKKLDNMRKEFVANVSHEMRTPLTTIKGYTETLLDGALSETEMAKNFLNIIESETDRMTFLVQDLLELSRFDNLQFSLNIIEINLVSLIHEVIIQNTFNAEKKSQTIKFTKNINEAIVRGDHGRIVQVLTNILTNAIKYTIDEGEILITLEDLENTYIVSIKDSGIGIPKEDLLHIFERFYRVDKARSRQMGGTGLGLSIAKEIMELHKGKIEVQSQVGIGSTFILSFSKDFGKDEN